MGYKTQFKLEVISLNQTVHSCEHEVREGDIFCPTCGTRHSEVTATDRAFNILAEEFNVFLTRSSDGLSWYHYEEHMIEISKRLKGVTFRLQGIGEDYPDIWVKYFRDGKMHGGKAEIIFPEYNGKLLEAPKRKSSTTPRY